MNVFRISTIFQVWGFNIDETVLIRDAKKCKYVYGHTTCEYLDSSGEA